MANHLDSSRKEIKDYATPIFVFPAIRLSAYWNSWITYQDSTNPILNGALEKGKTYRVHFDLAALDYGNPRIPNSMLALDKGLQNLEQIPTEKRRVKIHAIPYGGLTIQQGPIATETRKLDLERLKSLGANFDVSASPHLLSTRYGALIDVSGETPQSKRIWFDVLAEDTSMVAGVLFSIWNEAGDRTIGNVVRPAVIVESGSPMLNTMTDTGIGTGVDAPRLTRLDAPGLGFDASLLALEIASGHTAFVFTDQSNGKVYSWTRRSSLERDIKTLVADIEVGHSILALYNPAQYSKDLERMIFDVGNSANTDGSDALAALRTLAKISKNDDRKRFVAKFITRGGTLFIPIHLISVDNGGEVPIGRVLRIQQPLNLDYTGSGGCLNRWYGAFDPDATPSAFQNVVGGFDEDKDPKLELYKSMEAFKNFLWTKPKSGSTGDVLMVLAHHDRDSIRFHSIEPRAIKPSDMTREFPRQSVAVLAVCSVANIDNNGRYLLDTLNRKGVGAAIVSPFGVPDEIGGALLQELRKAGLAAVNSNSRVTLHDLYHSAIEGLASGDSKLSEQHKRIAHEFQVVGAGSVELCQ
jgi:hypothetical protein